MSSCGHRPGGWRGTKSFGEELEKVLRAKRFYHKSKFRALTEAWRAAVGDAIAAQAHVGSYEHGCATVDVESAVVLHELSGFMKASLLEQLRATPGGEDVVDLRFQLCNEARSR